jgi:hypothetical protein
MWIALLKERFGNITQNGGILYRELGAMEKQQLQTPQQFNTPINFCHYVSRPLYVRLMLIQKATG